MCVIALDINLGETCAGPAWKLRMSMLERVSRGIFPGCNLVMASSSRSTLRRISQGVRIFKDS
jgi:hypothetical protein